MKKSRFTVLLVGKKLFFCILIFAAAAGVLTACGTSDSNEPASMAGTEGSSASVEETTPTETENSDDNNSDAENTDSVLTTRQSWRQYVECRSGFIS